MSVRPPVLVRVKLPESQPSRNICSRPRRLRPEAKRQPASQNAVLAGDPAKPGPYVVLTRWLKGNHFSRPHFHPNDRFITVLKGTWWVGTGNKFDPANTVPMPAGTVVTHYGKQVHWDGAKDEDAVLLIMGEGPATANPFIPASSK